MRPIEDIAREALNSPGCERLREWAAIGPVQRAAVESLCAIVRAEALEDAAALCDVTPPYPFRASIEAAHAIRYLATNQRDKPRG